MLVLVAAILTVTLPLLLIHNLGTSTKVTPNHTASTDVAEPQFQQALELLRSVEANEKEVLPTVTPPPSPTATSENPSEKEDIVQPTPEDPTGQIVVPDHVEEPDQAAEADQVVENVWITFYDCTQEGFCPGDITASGAPLETESGTLYAACDTNYWPFGTEIRVLGNPNDERVWTCLDTGGLVIGPNHWDFWFYKHEDGENYIAELGSDVATIQIVA